MKNLYRLSITRTFHDGKYDVVFKKEIAEYSHITKGGSLSNKNGILVHRDILNKFLVSRIGRDHKVQYFFNMADFKIYIYVISDVRHYCDMLENKYSEILEILHIDNFYETVKYEELKVDSPWWREHPKYNEYHLLEGWELK